MTRHNFLFYNFYPAGGTHWWRIKDQFKLALLWSLPLSVIHFCFTVLSVLVKNILLLWSTQIWDVHTRQSRLGWTTCIKEQKVRSSLGFNLDQPLNNNLTFHREWHSIKIIMWTPYARTISTSTIILNLKPGQSLIGIIQFQKSNTRIPNGTSSAWLWNKS